MKAKRCGVSCGLLCGGFTAEYEMNAPATARETSKTSLPLPPPGGIHPRHRGQTVETSTPRRAGTCHSTIANLQPPKVRSPAYIRTRTQKDLHGPRAPTTRGPRSPFLLRPAPPIRTF